MYKDFVSFFVSGVVGIRQFNQNKCNTALRKYNSVSDEAFTLLTLENNWDRWSDMADKEEWRDSDEPSKWTTSNEKCKAVMMNQAMQSSENKNVTLQAKHYRGWSAKGIARYNQIFAEVKAERAKKEYGNFEKYCMEKFTEDMENKGKHKSKHQKVDTDKVLPSAKHELWDDDTCIQEDNNNLEVTIRANLPQALQNLGGVGARTAV
jgi:hypothetical protein